MKKQRVRIIVVVAPFFLSLFFFFLSYYSYKTRLDGRRRDNREKRYESAGLNSTMICLPRLLAYLLGCKIKDRQKNFYFEVLNSNSVGPLFSLPKQNALRKGFVLMAPWIPSILLVWSNKNRKASLPVVG